MGLPSAFTSCRLATAISGVRPRLYSGTCMNGCIEDDKAYPEVLLPRRGIAHGAGTKDGVVGWAFWSTACGATNGTTPRLQADASSGSGRSFMTGSIRSAGSHRRRAATGFTCPGLARGCIGLSFCTDQTSSGLKLSILPDPPAQQARH